MEINYIERLFDKELEFYLKCVGAIQIVGPKWCGKSTTAKRHANSIIDLMKDSDRKQFIPLAMESPETLLDYGKKPLLIDEWQVITFIFNSLKAKIDENGTFGQYILTGSVTDATIKSKSNINQQEKHTGTGRILKRMMRTMSLLESKDSTGEISLNELKKGKFKNVIIDKTINDYAYLICRGGWPLSVDKEESIALQQAKTFYNGLINEDIFSINDVKIKKDIQRAQKFIRAYARNVASQASNESIRKDLVDNGDEMNIETFNKYMLVLKRLFVIDELEAWNTNLRSKTAIRSKNTRYFVDPSIAAVALGFTKDNLLFDIKTFGLLFESLAIRDLKIYAEYLGANIYHYRDKLDREADAVIVFEDGSWGLIEIKLSNEDEIKKSSNKIVALAKDIKNKNKPNPSFLMIITANRTSYIDENGVYVVPLGALGV